MAGGGGGEVLERVGDGWVGCTTRVVDKGESGWGVIGRILAS